MFTFRMMYNSTPVKIIENSFRVNIKPFNHFLGEDNNGSYTYFNYHARDLDGARKVIVKVYSTNHTWIHCDCPWFRYNCEVALAMRGSSTITKSNGQPPKIRNPLMKPMVCKHGIATLVDLSMRQLISI